MSTQGIKDPQSATADGRLLRELIAGVELHEMPNIVTGNGVTTEVVRSDWPIGRLGIDHIIHVQLHAHAVSAWHCHQIQTDRIFVTDGTFRVVLYDDRDGSATKGMLNVLHLSRMRPTLILIPPFVWHGLQNLENRTGSFINFFDRAYCYENPDEWRLPVANDTIPYTFTRG